MAKLKNKPKEGMKLHKQIALGAKPSQVAKSKGATKQTVGKK
jgi:hypothetical protein